MEIRTKPSKPAKKPEKAKTRTATTRLETKKAGAVGKDKAGKQVERQVYQLKHKLGILLRDGFVGESAKAKMRQAALKRPDLFGEWAAL